LVSWYIRGDGSFGIYKNGKGVKFARIQFVNTDLSLIKEVARLLGTGEGYEVPHDHIGNKTVYRVTVSAKDKIITTLKMMLPFIKGQKKETVKRILEEFDK
jgi:hypothetical protein